MSFNAGVFQSGVMQETKDAAKADAGGHATRELAKDFLTERVARRSGHRRVNELLKASKLPKAKNEKFKTEIEVLKNRKGKHDQLVIPRCIPEWIIKALSYFKLTNLNSGSGRVPI
ncbi:hypothetical protein CF319_g2363 [Tilletia indica]|uniref:Uncharacterized protein n=1 Tax=Tilletia indica TaxID=43049 RepID=A0A177TUS9_9BASI|nr:hypothetical protein CF319_g2363 [Tilletia indica]KAE8240155.1 hypothetical protein A4X13_0g7920 [Tilletia indica]